MQKRLPTQVALLDPQDAITVYLDALLCEVAFADEVPSANQIETNVIVPMASPMAVERDEIAEPAVQAAPVAVDAQPERKTYPWAQGRFQCLSFQVAGLTLAAPLEKLHGIIKWDEAMTALPGYAPWFLGLQQNRGHNVQVVDAAQIVMADGRRPDKREARERVQFVVLVDGGRWGLAVDKIAEVVTLEPDDVRWSSVGGKRPWLAGTVIEHMCALLDVDALCSQLELTRK